MAKATPEIINALRNTAQALNQARDYQWGHMGRCNCGFLAQEITHLSGKAIHHGAMQKYGDWNEQLNDYCPDSGYLMDDLITALLEFGFDTRDLANLERLADERVLRHLPNQNTSLLRNSKDDVVLYITTWADMLEEEMLDKVSISEVATMSCSTV